MNFELHNDRAFHLSKILGMAPGMGVWNRESNILVAKGVKGTPNVARTLRSLVDADKKYRVAEGKFFTGAQIVELAEKYEAANAGEPCYKVFIGNHRACGLVLGSIIYGYKTEPQMIEVDPADGATLSINSHAGNRYTSPLAYKETLDLVVAQVKAGKFTQENQVRKLFGDGTGQKLWAHQKLLTLGVEEEKVVQLNKEEARKAAETLNAADAVDKVLIAKATEGSNKGKVLQGEKIRNNFNLCTTADPEIKDDLTLALKAIVENNEMALTAVVARHFKVEAKPAKSKK
jgi:hypothetical protein